MICLGIESTAHTFGVGIMNDKGQVLANEKSVYTTQEGGMIPNEVAEHHKKVKEQVLKKALTKAKITMNEIDLVSYSRGPGLAPCLKVGMEFAKSLKKPTVGINHCIAHLTIGEVVCKTKNPVYLYISGVNTQVIARAGKKYRIFGETLDIGLGNALDTFGRTLGLGFPAGPKIEKLAETGKYVELPYTVKGMDLAFSGIVTKAEKLFKKGIPKEDLCYSFQETAFAMLAEVAERALAHCQRDELLVIGGVAANKRLSTILKTMCEQRKAKYFVVPLDLAGDQGAMIAWQGIQEKENTGKNLDIYPYERIDDIEL